MDQKKNCFKVIVNVTLGFLLGGSLAASFVLYMFAGKQKPPTSHDNGMQNQNLTEVTLEGVFNTTEYGDRPGNSTNYTQLSMLTTAQPAMDSIYNTTFTTAFNITPASIASTTITNKASSVISSAAPPFHLASRQLHVMNVSDFYYIYGGYGESISCMESHVATGACASGLYKSCYGYVTFLKCCKFNNREELNSHNVAELRVGHCEKINRRYGFLADCGPMRAVQGICGSGASLDCADRSSHSAICCKVPDGTVIKAMTCKWLWADYGQNIQCSSQKVMVGFCASGSNRDCDWGKHSHGIKCCSIKPSH